MPILNGTNTRSMTLSASLVPGTDYQFYLLWQTNPAVNNFSANFTVN